MACQVTLTGRTFSTSSIHREVIQAKGQVESNQKSTFWVSCAVCAVSVTGVLLKGRGRAGLAFSWSNRRSGGLVPALTVHFPGDECGLRTVPHDLPGDDHGGDVIA